GAQPSLKWAALRTPRRSSAPPRRFDGGDVDLLHRHHRREGALRLTATSRKRLGERARGDLPGQAPSVLAPTALALLAAIADDRVPVAVRLFLSGGRDLEGEGLAVPELRAAVETETGNAQNGELHRQDIALLAARVVTGGLVHSDHCTIRKGGGVEARRLMRVLVEPEADRVLGLHTCVLLVLVRRRTPASPCKSWTASATIAHHAEAGAGDPGDRPGRVPRVRAPRPVQLRRCDDRRTAGGRRAR